MLAGYGWLVVASGVWLTGSGGADGVPVGSGYDAVIHAVFLGFTMSMIMAHAPVILPAVLRRPLPYHPVLIVPIWPALSVTCRVGCPAQLAETVDGPAPPL